MEGSEEEEEEVKLRDSVCITSLHHLLPFTWTSPIQLWITTCVRLWNCELCGLFSYHEDISASSPPRILNLLEMHTKFQIC